MAEAVREAYGDLFQVNTGAQRLSKQEVINKFKTLSQGAIGESVLDKMAMTFTALVKLGNFELQSAIPAGNQINFSREDPPESSEASEDTGERRIPKVSRSIGGLHYNIQIILPESRDPKVYDALFRSLNEHLL